MNLRIGKALGPIAVALGMLLGLEAVLAALDLGRGRPVYQNAGNQIKVNYLVPDEAHPGGWITQFGTTKVPEVEIPPKDKNRKRFVFLGASNTHSFFPQIAEKYLDEIAGPGRWEVINLGRGGYGSERVKRITEESLEKLAPDAFLVYAGDNDFHDMEGFQNATQEVPDIRNDLRIAGSRTIGLIRELATSRSASKPVLWSPPPAEHLRMLSLEQTRVHQESTRRNLHTILGMAKEKGVKVVFMTILYNRFTAPTAWQPNKSDLGKDWIKVVQDLSAAEGLVPARLRAVIPTPKDRPLHMSSWSDRRDSTTKERATMVQSESDQDAWRRPTTQPLDTYAHWNNPSWMWGQDAWEAVNALDLLKSRAFTKEELTALWKMEVLLKQVLEIVPDHPRAHWIIGLVGMALGRDPETVREHLMLAASYDRTPKRGNEALNNIIREVAQEHPEVLFMDMDRRIAGMCADSILGYEWMLDHCHIQLGTRHLMLEEMTRAFLKRWPEMK